VTFKKKRVSQKS